MGKFAKNSNLGKRVLPPYKIETLLAVQPRKNFVLLGLYQFSLKSDLFCWDFLLSLFLFNKHFLTLNECFYKVLRSHGIMGNPFKTVC